MLFGRLLILIGVALVVLSLSVWQFIAFKQGETLYKDQAAWIAKRFVTGILISAIGLML